MPDPEPPVISGDIGQIALAVRDLRASIAFYRETLGLPLLFEVPPNMAFFKCGSVRLMLSAGENADNAKPTSAIYFRVSRIQSVCEVLTRRGAVFEKGAHLIAKMPDHELWMAFLRDPDGQLFGLMEEVRP